MQHFRTVGRQVSMIQTAQLQGEATYDIHSKIYTNQKIKQ
jgi:hypothetical protein